MDQHINLDHIKTYLDAKIYSYKDIKAAVEYVLSPYKTPKRGMRDLFKPGRISKDSQTGFEFVPTGRIITDTEIENAIIREL